MGMSGPLNVNPGDNTLPPRTDLPPPSETTQQWQRDAAAGNIQVPTTAGQPKFNTQTLTPEQQSAFGTSLAAVGTPHATPGNPFLAQNQSGVQPGFGLPGTTGGLTPAQAQGIASGTTQATAQAVAPPPAPAAAPTPPPSDLEQMRQEQGFVDPDQQQAQGPGGLTLPTEYGGAVDLNQMQQQLFGQIDANLQSRMSAMNATQVAAMNRASALAGMMGGGMGGQFMAGQQQAQLNTQQEKSAIQNAAGQERLGVMQDMLRTAIDREDTQKTREHVVETEKAAAEAENIDLNDPSQPKYAPVNFDPTDTDWPKHTTGRWGENDIPHGYDGNTGQKYDWNTRIGPAFDWKPEMGTGGAILAMYGGSDKLVQAAKDYKDKHPSISWEGAKLKIISDFVNKVKGIYGFAVRAAQEMNMSVQDWWAAQPATVNEARSRRD